ncbi:hypothetical protein T03_1350 [Trichinella britovi]|uniref:Uncharacterized protein n=1 Tax=Trichinella britovi TaxID=45882 RepID=A0A0V1DB89_TRIBR|nr:hypothetical protein T03_1350 [Trichinella britovi]
MNVDVNKERINKHVYLVSSALPGWWDACQIKSLSDPSSEPLLVRNYCARRTIGTKAWAVNEIQIYALWLPTRIISNDYIICSAYTDVFLYKLGSSIQGMDGKQLLIPLWYNLESTIHAPGSHGCQQSNVGTRRNYQDIPPQQFAQEDLVQLTTAVNSPRGQLAAWSSHRDYLCLWHSLKS